MRASATRNKLNIFSILNIKNRTILTYRNFILKKFVLFVLTLDHIGNAFLYFDLYGHGKLNLKFVHGRAKSRLEATRFVQKRCTFLRPKSPKKIIEPRVLEKKVCLFVDTLT